MPAKTSKTKTRSKAPERTRETQWRQQGAVVVGIDEVGRGAWAGPLVVGAVSLPEEFSIEGIRDSKFLSPARREELAPLIHQHASVGIGVVEAFELEQGMAWGLGEAAQRALKDGGFPSAQILLDGHHDYLGAPHSVESIIGGDRTELCIAAASVVAKVHRDRLMVELEKDYTAYGFAAHKGYGTAVHRDAIKAHGPCVQHRTGWKPFATLV